MSMFVPNPAPASLTRSPPNTRWFLGECLTDKQELYLSAVAGKSPKSRGPLVVGPAWRPSTMAEPHVQGCGHGSCRREPLAPPRTDLAGRHHWRSSLLSVRPGQSCFSRAVL